MVEAIARMLADPGAAGRTYDVAGPRVYTWHELIGSTAPHRQTEFLLVSVPFAMAGILARLFELLPRPPLTTSQVDLLKADNVASGNLPGLRELDIQPKSLEEVLPTYVGDRGRAVSA